MGLRDKLLGRIHENVQQWKDDLFTEFPRPSDVKLGPHDVEAWTLAQLQTTVVISQHLMSKGCNLTDLEKYLNWYRQAEERKKWRSKVATRSGHILSRADIKASRAEASKSPAQKAKYLQRKGVKS